MLKVNQHRQAQIQPVPVPLRQMLISNNNNTNNSNTTTTINNNNNSKLIQSKTLNNILRNNKDCTFFSRVSINNVTAHHKQHINFDTASVTHASLESRNSSKSRQPKDLNLNNKIIITNNNLNLNANNLNTNLNVNMNGICNNSKRFSNTHTNNTNHFNNALEKENVPPPHNVNNTNTNFNDNTQTCQFLKHKLEKGGEGGSSAHKQRVLQKQMQKNIKATTLANKIQTHKSHSAQINPNSTSSNNNNNRITKPQSANNAMSYVKQIMMNAKQQLVHFGHIDDYGGKLHHLVSKNKQPFQLTLVQTHPFFNENNQNQNISKRRSASPDQLDANLADNSLNASYVSQKSPNNAQQNQHININPDEVNNNQQHHTHQYQQKGLAHAYHQKSSSSGNNKFSEKSEAKRHSHYSSMVTPFQDSLRGNNNSNNNALQSSENGQADLSEYMDCPRKQTLVTFLSHLRTIQTIGSNSKAQMQEHNEQVKQFYREQIKAVEEFGSNVCELIKTITQSKVEEMKKNLASNDQVALKLNQLMDLNVADMKFIHRDIAQNAESILTSMDEFAFTQILSRYNAKIQEFHKCNVEIVRQEPFQPQQQQQLQLREPYQKIQQILHDALKQEEAQSSASQPLQLNIPQTLNFPIAAINENKKCVPHQQQSTSNENQLYVSFDDKTAFQNAIQKQSQQYQLNGQLNNNNTKQAKSKSFQMQQRSNNNNNHVKIDLTAISDSPIASSKRQTNTNTISDTNASNFGSTMSRSMNGIKSTQEMIQKIMSINPSLQAVSPQGNPVLKQPTSMLNSQQGLHNNINNFNNNNNIGVGTQPVKVVRATAVVKIDAQNQNEMLKNNQEINKKDKIGFNRTQIIDSPYFKNNQFSEHIR